MCMCAFGCVPIQELAGRFLANEILNRYDVCTVFFAVLLSLYVHSNSRLATVLAQYHPDIHQLLVKAGTCAVCGQAVVNSWLECVHFKSARTVRNTASCHPW